MIDAAYMESSITEFRATWRGWQDRARRMRSMVQSEGGAVMSAAEMASMIAVDPKRAASASAEYVSSRCAVIMRNFIGRGIANPPKIEPLVLEEGKQDQVAQRKLFQMLGGIHNVLDDHIQTTVQGVSWDAQMLKHLFIFGKVCILPHACYAPGSNERAEFTAALYDPLQVMHDFDSWPRRTVYEAGMGGADAEHILNSYMGESAMDDRGELMYPKAKINPGSTAKLKDRDGKYKKSVVVSDFWCEERNLPASVKAFTVWHGILVDGESCGVWKTSFDHSPWVIQAAHTSPSSYQDVQAGAAGGDTGSTRGLDANRVLYHAEGFLAPIYHVNQQFLQSMSNIMEGAARAFVPGEDITLSEDAGPADIPPAEHSGPGARRIHRDTVKIGLQETVQASIGEALRLYFDRVEAEFERLVPGVQFGQSNPGDAGYLQVIKTNAASAVAQETIKAASAAGKRTFDEFIYQMRQADLKFHVEGWRQNGKAGPQDFEGGDFSSADLPPQFILNYQMLFDLPPNEAAKAEVARAMKDGGWMSDREIEVNIFDNPDPDKTLALLEEQRQYNSPEAQMSRDRYAKRQMVADLLAEAEAEKDVATRNAILLEAYIAQQEYDAMVAMALPQTEPQQAKPSGFSPGTMAPEEGVGTNGDRNAQNRGAVSSYTGGKPRTKAAV